MLNLEFNDEDYLEIDNLFGLDVACKNSIGFISNSFFVYVVGSYLIVINIENYKTKLINIKNKGQICCMEISSDKNFVFLVDLEPNLSTLLVLDLKKTNNNIDKVKIKKKIKNCFIQYIAISNNMELILCQTNLNTNWKLLIYSFNKLEKKAEVYPISNILLSEQTVEEVSFLPNENKKFILVGHKLVKMYQYFDLKHIKLIFNIECIVSIESHTRFTKNEIIIYDKYSNFYIIDLKQNLIKSLNLSNKHEFNISNSIDKIISNKKNHKRKPSIISTNNGLFLSNATNAVFYYKFECLNNFYLIYSIRLPGNKNQEFINKIYINDSKTILIVISNKNIVYIHHLVDQTKDINNNSFEFEVLIENYHYHTITSIDSCVRKPLMVSCSLDGCLNIWNYDTKSIELRQEFDYDLLSVAIHPSGIYLILCSAYNLRYMEINTDVLSLMHTLKVRNCTNCIFSNGGHMFAFVQGTVVQIYLSYKFSEIGAIKTQEMGKIKQLKFTDNDNYLVCCSIAGIIRIWNCCNLSVVHEIITKGLSYIGLALNLNQEMLFLISTEKAIRQFQLPLSDDLNSFFKSNTQAKLIKKMETKNDENLTCIEISKSNKLLCVGTNKGTLRVILLSTGNFKEYKAHSSSITKICIAFNDELLLTSSDDGIIVSWKISKMFKYQYNDTEYLLASNKPLYKTIFLEQEMVLTNKKEFMLKSHQIIDTERKIENLTYETDFKLRLKDLKFKIKIKELNYRFKINMIILKNQKDDLIADQVKSCNYFHLAYEEKMVSHLNDIYNLQDNLSKKIEKEKINNYSLKSKISRLKIEETEVDINIKKIQNDFLTKHYDNVEINLKKLNENHLIQINNLSHKLNKMNEYEIIFEKELELEKIKINFSYQTKLFKLRKEKYILIDKLSNFQNELNNRRRFLNQLLQKNEKKYKFIFKYTERLKEMNLFDLELKKNFEMQNEKIKDNKEIIELEKDLNVFENYNKNVENSIRTEFKYQFEPLKYDNMLMEKSINETKNEIDDNKTNIFKINNKIKYLKKIYRVKFEQLTDLNKKINKNFLSNTKIVLELNKMIKKAEL
jgi:cilia- and flagella-associated protein 57